MIDADLQAAAAILEMTYGADWYTDSTRSFAGSRWSPYGCKGKGKGRGKFKGPKEQKPLVNPNHINPAKEPLNGGISFKNILQEQVSKRKATPILQGDIVYESTRIRGGRACTLLLPCLGQEHRFETAPDRPGTDEKQAGQMVAALALEALFPDVNIAVHEAHLQGAEAALASGNADLENPETLGASPPPVAVDLEGEPKGLLNSRVQIAVERQIVSGDIIYETTWNFAIRGYQCTLHVKALEPADDPGVQAYTAEVSGSTDKRQSEKAAARLALEANRAVFEEAVEKREQKKAAEARKKAKGNSKGSKNQGRDPVHSRDSESHRDQDRHRDRERDRERDRGRSRDRGTHRHHAMPPGYGPPSPYGPPPGYGAPLGYGIGPPGPYGYPPAPAFGSPYGPPAFPAYGYAPPPGYPGPPPGYGPALGYR